MVPRRSSRSKWTNSRLTGPQNPPFREASSGPRASAGLLADAFEASLSRARLSGETRRSRPRRRRILGLRLGAEPHGQRSASPSNQGLPRRRRALLEPAPVQVAAAPEPPPLTSPRWDLEAVICASARPRNHPQAPGKARIICTPLVTCGCAMSSLPTSSIS